MGRPQKNNAEYFPHFSGLRNHRKVKILKNKFGNLKGYAFWCLVLEWLTEHDGLEFEYAELEIEMFAAELGVSATEIPPMIDFCIKLEMLFLNEHNFIYSESLNEYLNPVFEKRQRERNKSKSRQRKENGTFKTTSGGVSAAEIPQSKVKKSKVEKKVFYQIPGIENIQVTFIENENLIKEYGEEITCKAYQFLSDYKTEKGYKTKSDYLTIKRWVVDAIKKNFHNASSKTNGITNHGKTAGAIKLVNSLAEDLKGFNHG